ncbi:hypothetical protein V6C27_14205 [Peptococcaceae bacterium 1198_IL3148]
MAEQDEVDHVIRWMQKAIKKRNDYPPKITFKNPNGRKKYADKAKVEHKEKIYDSVLMS